MVIEGMGGDDRESRKWDGGSRMWRSAGAWGANNQGRRSVMKRAILAVAVSVFGMVIGSVARGQEIPPQRERVLSPYPLLSVTGEGTVSVAPDMATVHLGVFAQEKEAAA